jgi:transcriptional regulator with XRE-family HTH domain
MRPYLYSGRRKKCGLADRRTPVASHRVATQATAKQFGSRLRSLRQERGLTQQALAEASDLSVGMISMLERRQRTPHLGSLEALAKALDVEVSDLFETCDEHPPLPHMEKHLEGKVRDGKLPLRAACQKLHKHATKAQHAPRSGSHESA